MMRSRMQQVLAEKVIPPLSTAWRKGQHGTRPPPMRMEMQSWG